MPQHPVLKAGIYLVALTIATALALLFWRGTHDSPYPTPSPPIDYTDVQLPLGDPYYD